MFQSIARPAVTPEKSLSLSNTIIQMNDALVQSAVSKIKRTLDTVHEQVVLRDTERRQKITTSDHLFAKNIRLEENENVEELTTDSTSFEAQVNAKMKAAIRTIGAITPIEDFKILR
ncbi:unnamed protein product, partial [Rotaria sp. Silwood2]